MKWTNYDELQGPMTPPTPLLSSPEPYKAVTLQHPDKSCEIKAATPSNYARSLGTAAPPTVVAPDYRLMVSKVGHRTGQESRRTSQVRFRTVYQMWTRILGAEPEAETSSSSLSTRPGAGEHEPRRCRLRDSFPLNVTPRPHTKPDGAGPALSS